MYISTGGGDMLYSLWAEDSAIVVFSVENVDCIRERRSEYFFSRDHI